MAFAENELVRNFNETRKTEAEKCVVEQFPERIIQLHELLKKPEFCIPVKNLKCTLMKAKNNFKNDESTEIDHAPTNSSEIKEDTSEKGLMQSNKNITDALDLLKPYILKLFDDAVALRMWVTLSLPKDEYGNNFGVCVLEDTLDDIHHAEADAKKLLDCIPEYYLNRGRLITKIMKHPEVEDYRQAIEELDENRYWLITETIYNLCNCYLTLHNVVLKNLAEIKNPRL